MLISVGLILFELAEGQFKSLNALSFGLEFKNPQIVICFAYAALIYFIWRFWIYSQDSYKALITEFDLTFQNRKIYLNDISQFISDFRDKSRIAELEGYRDAFKEDSLSDKTVNTLKPIEEIKIIKKFFKRTLLLYVDDEHGDLNFTKEEYNLKYSRYALDWLSAWLVTVLNKKTFSDLIVPYLVALTAIIIKSYQIYSL